MTWPGPLLLLWERGRKDQGWSWGGRGKGETLWLHSPTPRKHLLSLAPLLLPWPPKIPSLLFCLWPSWLLLMLPLAFPWTDTPVGCLGFNQPPKPYSKYPSAFPASAPPQYHPLSPLGQNLNSPPLSSLPLGKKTTTKKKAPTPQEGAADSGGGDKRRRAQDLLGKGSQIPGRKGKGLKVEGSGCCCPLPPLLTVQGISTQLRGQVFVGSALDREKKGAGETLLKPSEFLLPPFCLEAPWLMKSREELVGRGDCTKKSFPPLSPLPHQLGAHQGWEGSG